MLAQQWIAVFIERLLAANRRPPPETYGSFLITGGPMSLLIACAQKVEVLPYNNQPITAHITVQENEGIPKASCSGPKAKSATALIQWVLTVQAPQSLLELRVGGG